MTSRERGGNCWNRTCSICWTIEPIGAGTQELNLEMMTLSNCVMMAIVIKMATMAIIIMRAIIGVMAYEAMPALRNWT